MKRILIVDDNKVIRRVVRQMLESSGFTVDEVEDGARCLTHCHEHGIPDGIVLDINMPEMDGITCLRTMRADPAFRDKVQADGSEVVSLGHAEFTAFMKTDLAKLKRVVELSGARVD